MGIFGSAINYIIDMGASAMLPLVIAILSIIVGVKIGKAVRAGLMVGVGFVGLGLIFIPLTILIAIIVPGNTILPFGDLATIGFFIGIAVAVHRGNLFRSLISGCVIMFTTIWIASQAIPWTTALAKSVNLTNGASQVAALDQGGSPITYLYTQIVTQQNIKGLAIIGIIYVICMIFTVRGSKQRAAALKESEY